MGSTTGIPWTGATWNPIQGCFSTGIECENCYMFRDMERYGRDPENIRRSAAATFDAPLKWQREAERGDRTGTDRLVFTASWSDWFLPEVDGWREDMWAVVRACPLLTFQVLTKRANRIKGGLPSDWGTTGYPNVWMMVSVGVQKSMWRVDKLREIPAVVRGISVEPLLELVDLSSCLGTAYCDECREEVDIGVGTLQGPPREVPLADWPLTHNGVRYCPVCNSSAIVEKPGWIDWIIVGGESGNRSGRFKARPCNVNWIRSVVRQCQAAGVPCFVKQLGSAPYWVSYNENSTTDPGDEIPIRLKGSHGEDMEEWTGTLSDLRVREFPRVASQAAEGVGP